MIIPNDRRPFESEKALEFGVLAGARPMMETFLLEHAPQAYRKMRSREARFWMVLTMESV